MKREVITRTEEYKYLEHWINKKGIRGEWYTQKNKKKARGMAVEAERLRHESKTEKMSTDEYWDWQLTSVDKLEKKKLSEIWKFQVLHR